MKKLKTIRFISVILIVIGGILALIAYVSEKDVAETLYFTAMFIFFPIGFGMFFIVRTKLMKICTKCGSSMRGCAYQYEETNRTYSEQGNTYTVTVIYEAECPNCGTIKSFQKKFTVNYGANLEREARIYGEKYFR